MVKKRPFLLHFPGKCVIITVIFTGLAAARLTVLMQKLRPMKSTLSTGVRSMPYVANRRKGLRWLKYWEGLRGLRRFPLFADVTLNDIPVKRTQAMSANKEHANHTSAYLSMIGVPAMPPRTSPFDPGYDLSTVAGHLEQSGHIMSSLKISMACWQIANEDVLRRKIAEARRVSVPVCMGGGPFEIAMEFGKLAEYMDLCADIQATRIEAGQGFTDIALDPVQVCREAAARNLDLQYEIGGKSSGPFTTAIVQELIDTANRWLDAGAKCIVVEGRENALDVGVFSREGELDKGLVERLLEALGMETVVFEAPTKQSQFAFLQHFGPEIQLSNVRLEELLRVEVYRRGLHSDAFEHERLRPAGSIK